jgi:hypothetical protein
MPNNIEKLVEKLDDSFKRWGFDVFRRNMYGRHENARCYQPQNTPPYLMDLIINDESFLFYFKKALLRRYPDLLEYIQSLAGYEHATVLENGIQVDSYRCRVKDESGLNNLITFISERIISRITLN